MGAQISTSPATEFVPRIRPTVPRGPLWAAELDHRPTCGPNLPSLTPQSQKNRTRANNIACYCVSCSTSPANRACKRLFPATRSNDRACKRKSPATSLRYIACNWLSCATTVKNTRCCWLSCGFSELGTVSNPLFHVRSKAIKRVDKHSSHALRSHTGCGRRGVCT